MRAQNQRRGGEIRAGDDGDQLFGRDRGPPAHQTIDEGEAAVDHFAKVVRRDIGGHANGNAARAIDQQIGKTRRQHLRLLPRSVVVLGEINSVLVEIL